MKFQDLGLSAPLLRAIEEKGYETPTPIQEQAIPPVLRGRDLQGCAQTGTGKTAAFTLPILQLLTEEPPVRGRREIRALVLTPTRELAIQIDECCRDYARYTPIRHCVIFGGVNQRPQVEALQRGVDLLIATPGRLLDLIGQGYITLAHLRFFVLDEADRMLDMGFIHDIRRILPLLPAERQTLFFSATMPEDIAALAARILHDPEMVAVTPPASVVETIAQRVHFAEKGEKSQLLIDLLGTTDTGQVLVFTRTKHGADRLAKILNRAGIGAAAIHGNKSQNARVRAMNDFKSGACRVLIATDIAARGIDIDQLPLVINYELPEVAETYVHRIGRTGRAGREGSAWSFCSEAELEYLLEIQKLTGLTLPIEGEIPPYAAEALEAFERKMSRKQPAKAKTAGKSAPKKGAPNHTPKADAPESAPKNTPSESPVPTTAPKTTAPKEALETGTPSDAPKKSRRRRHRGKGKPAAGATATPTPAAAPATSAAEKSAAKGTPKQNGTPKKSGAASEQNSTRTGAPKQPAPATPTREEKTLQRPRRNRHRRPQGPKGETAAAGHNPSPASREPRPREENRISHTNDWKKRVKSLLLRTFGK